MKRFVFLLLLLSGCAVVSPLQNSRFIAFYNLIEIAKYDEAKEVVEEMIVDDNLKRKSKTWYARGLLCQTAYKEGKEKNDPKKYNLYPDQLMVAFESYEKARSLDKRGHLDRQLVPRYVLLANDFLKIGEDHFKKAEFEKAFKAFEYALQITQNPLLAMEVDNNLIFNAAVAAYHANKKAKAIEYLSRLDEKKYSINALHLLSTTYLETGDTISAERVLMQGIDRYDDNEQIFILLSDLLYNKGEVMLALKTLDIGIEAYNSKPVFYKTKGLILQKSNRYEEAIESYTKAVEMEPDELMTYANIATCYYNIGVDIDDNSMRINNSRIVAEERERSQQAYRSAEEWLDKIAQKEPNDEAILDKMVQLYRSLNQNEKASVLQRRMNL